MTDVKICGISDPTHLDCAAKGGARFIGLVFYPPSSRYIDPEQARILARTAPTGVRTVGLFVNPDNAKLDRTVSAVPIDMIQLHGHEDPVRIAEIKSMFHIPVIKALPVAQPADLDGIADYEQVSDWLLFDAKTPQFGGSGQSFDWKILQNRKFARPWMLSGGLHAGNIKEALSTLSPDAVDVSSGVESAPGKKDCSKITEFLQAVRQA